MDKPIPRMKTLEAEIERGIELLTLCQTLQTEKDGVNRPAPFEIDKNKDLDQFSLDILAAIRNLSTVRTAIPQRDRLIELAKKLDREGKISLEIGDDLADATINYLCTKAGG